MAPAASPLQEPLSWEVCFTVKSPPSSDARFRERNRSNFSSFQTSRFSPQEQQSRSRACEGNQAEIKMFCALETSIYTKREPVTETELMENNGKGRDQPPTRKRNLDAGHGLRPKSFAGTVSRLNSGRSSKTAFGVCLPKAVKEISALKTTAYFMRIVERKGNNTAPRG